MSKTGKSLIIILAILGPSLVIFGLWVKLANWSEFTYKVIVICGFIFSTLAIGIATIKAKRK